MCEISRKLAKEKLAKFRKFAKLTLIMLPGACPLLCSGRGEYKNGECACKPGWKGKECSIRYEECEVSN